MARQGPLPFTFDRTKRHFFIENKFPVRLRSEFEYSNSSMDTDVEKIIFLLTRSSFQWRRLKFFS